MVKTCKTCGALFDDSRGTRPGPRRKYCSPGCKKKFENSQRAAVKREQACAASLVGFAEIARQPSEVAFGNLCFLHRELLRIGSEIDEVRRSIEAMLGASGVRSIDPAVVKQDDFETEPK